MLTNSLTVYQSEAQHFDTQAAVARSARMLALVLERVGRAPEASPYFRLAWRMRKEVVGIEGSVNDSDDDYAGMMFYWSQ